MRIDGLRLYTGGAEPKDIPGASVAVRGNRIVYAGPSSGAPPDGDTRVIRGLCMPAFYNAHTHLAMTLLRGAGTDLNLRDWLFTAIFPREDRLTPDIVAAGTRMAMLESIRFGVVGFAEMYFFTPRVAEAVLEAGVRAGVSRGLSGEDPAVFARHIAENEAFHREFHGAQGRIAVPVGIHAEYTSSPANRRMALESAHRLGAGIHIHASETRAEHDECVARHGVTPVALFAREGLLDAPQPALLAHGVWTTHEDRAILAEKGAYLAHCPNSNLKLGSGILPLGAAVEAGVRVALGTDGAASNNRLDVLSEARTAALLAKGSACDPTAMPASLAVAMGTASGAAACGFPEAGVLEEGALADFIVLDTDGPHAQPIRDAAGHIVYAASAHDVVLTVCDGRILYDHGTYTTLDARRIAEEFAEAWGTLDA